MLKLEDKSKESLEVLFNKLKAIEEYEEVVGWKEFSKPKRLWMQRGVKHHSKKPKGLMSGSSKISWDVGSRINLIGRNIHKARKALKSNIKEIKKSGWSGNLELVALFGIKDKK